MLLTSEILLEYFKKHKGKKYAEIAKILHKDGYRTRAGKITPEVIEMRAIRGGMTGYGHSKFIETTKELKEISTPENLKLFKQGKISEELFRQRAKGRRGDLKRSGSPERKLQSKKYREEAKLPGFEERAKLIKEGQFRSRAKEYLKKGMVPPAKNAKEELWRSLFTNGQDYKEGRRLKTLGKYSKYISRDKLLNATILDTKTNKPITFKNLEKYITSKNTGKTYAEVIKPYNQKWFINNTPGLRNEINSKLIKDWTPASKDTFFEIQHNAGKATHPFDVSLSNERVNLKEFGARNRFEKSWNKTKSISERKNLFKNYIDELPKGIVSQPSMVKRARTFGEDVPFDKQLRQLKSEGVKLPKGILQEVKSAFNSAQSKLISSTNKLSKLEQLKFCSLLSKGGLPGDCKQALKADPEKAAKILSEAPVTSAAMKNVKQDSQKLIRLFRGESFPQRNIKAMKRSAKHFGTTLAEMKKDKLSGQWFTPEQSHAGAYLARPGQMKYVDVTPAELEAIDKFKTKVNQTNVKFSEAARMGKPFKQSVTTSPAHKIIPRYKLKQMEEAGRLKTKLDLNFLKKNLLSDAPVKSTAGVLEWNSVRGGFVDSANPSEIVGQNQIKSWAADNPLPVKAGTEDAFKPISNSLLKNVGRTLAKVGAPLPTALIDSYFIGKQIQDDKPAAEIAKDPLNWLGLATMSTLTGAGGLTKAGVAAPGAMSSILRMGMNPGLIRGISRFAGLPGLAISTGLTAYDQYKKYQNEEGLIYNLFNDKARPV